MNKLNKVKVIFVCMGNICRSPTAHGVFESMVKEQKLADKIEIDSAGTHAYHVGEQPDRRSQQKALEYGVDLSYIRARKVEQGDFLEYDYVLAMDQDNYANLMRICPPEYKDKVSLFLDFSEQDLPTREVPDPYYGGAQGFENVYKLIASASRGLLKTITQ